MFSSETLLVHKPKLGALDNLWSNLRGSCNSPCALQLTDEVSPAALPQPPLPQGQAVNVFTSPGTPSTPVPAPSPSTLAKSALLPKAPKQPVAKTTIRTAFKIAIAPVDALPTVPEFDADGESTTPRAGGGGGTFGSGPLKSLSSMQSAFSMGTVDPVSGPMIDFWMLSQDETAPVEVEVPILLLM